MPWLSLSTTPIWDGVAPFFASLQIWSTTASGVVLSQAGGVREYGMAEALMPLPLLCRRPIVEVLFDRYQFDGLYLPWLRGSLWCCEVEISSGAPRNVRISARPFTFATFEFFLRIKTHTNWTTDDICKY